MFWRRRKLDEDMCITAVVALHLYMKRYESNSSTILTPSDIARFALERYGIEIPEDLARETLEKLVEMDIMEKKGNGYTLTDLASQIFASVYTATKDMKTPRVTELVQRGISIALILQSSGYSPRKTAATLKKLKKISECGMKTIKKLAKST
jgi:hypothetical protein